MTHWNKAIGPCQNLQTHFVDKCYCISNNQMLLKTKEICYDAIGLGRWMNWPNEKRLSKDKCRNTDKQPKWSLQKSLKAEYMFGTMAKQIWLKVEKIRGVGVYVILYLVSDANGVTIYC